MAKFKYLVFTNSSSGKDAEFNQWYNEVHLPDIQKVGVFRTGERYEVVPTAYTQPIEQRYAAIYEVEGENAVEALEKLLACAGRGEMRMSDAFDAGSSMPILIRSLDAGF